MFAIRCGILPSARALVNREIQNSHVTYGKRREKLESERDFAPGKLGKRNDKAFINAGTIR